jgi:hypothetical protein
MSAYPCVDQYHHDVNKHFSYVGNLPHLVDAVEAKVCVTFRVGSFCEGSFRIDWLCVCGAIVADEVVRSDVVWEGGGICSGTSAASFFALERLLENQFLTYQSIIIH